MLLRKNPWSAVGPLTLAGGLVAASLRKRWHSLWIGRLNSRLALALVVLPSAVIVQGHALPATAQGTPVPVHVDAHATWEHYGGPQPPPSNPLLVVSVRDFAGKYVTGLSKGNFLIWLTLPERQPDPTRLTLTDIERIDTPPLGRSPVTPIVTPIQVIYLIRLKTDGLPITTTSTPPIVIIRVHGSPPLRRSPISGVAITTITPRP